MNRNSAPLAPPSWTARSRLTTYKYSSDVTRSWPPTAPPNSLDHILQVSLPTRTILASKFTRSLPPSVFANLPSCSHKVYLQSPTIKASRFTTLWPPSSHNHHPELHLRPRTIMVFECHSMFTWSHWGEMVKPEGRQRIINTPPHLSCHPKYIPDEQWFSLQEHRMRVRWYEGIPGHDQPYKFRGSMHALQEFVRNHTNCMDVTPLVLQAYFRDHTASLDDPKMDIQSGITNQHSNSRIGSTIHISWQIGHISFTRPSRW